MTALISDDNCSWCAPGKYQTGVGMVAEVNCTWCAAGKYQNRYRYDWRVFSSQSIVQSLANLCFCYPEWSECTCSVQRGECINVGRRWRGEEGIKILFTSQDPKRILYNSDEWAKDGLTEQKCHRYHE